VRTVETATGFSSFAEFLRIQEKEGKLVFCVLEIDEWSD
jgi:hypothetical protein